MKIEYVKGSVTDASEAIIAQGCNAQGVMGSGVAKAIRDKWPEVFPFYKRHVEHFKTEYDSALGTTAACFVGTEEDHKMIFNMITQEYYGRDGKRYVDYDAVRECMRFANKRAGMYSYPPHRVAMPKIGAGFGGGDWETISQIIEEESTNFQPVVYEP